MVGFKINQKLYTTLVLASLVGHFAKALWMKMKCLKHCPDAIFSLSLLGVAPRQACNVVILFSGKAGNPLRQSLSQL
jgi:hypothetical protein